LTRVRSVDLRKVVDVRDGMFRMPGTAGCGSC
jgi:hypothetical protein